MPFEEKIDLSAPVIDADAKVATNVDRAAHLAGLGEVTLKTSSKQAEKASSNDPLKVDLLEDPCCEFLKPLKP